MALVCVLESKPLVGIGKLIQKQIRKRGLYEEATGLLHKTRPVDSTQEEPGLGKSPSKSYFFA